MEDANLTRTKIQAPKYASDHRDKVVDKNIPKGYKIIGVKGFRNTYDEKVIHVADFIIWKPPPFWLDISPEGLERREEARNAALNGNGRTGQKWLESKSKNFIRMN